jgi:WD40 repeat protein
MVGGHSLGVGGVDFSPDGQLAASASADETLKVWRVSDGTLLHTFAPSRTFQLHSATFSLDGQFVVGTGTGGAYMWRLSDGTLAHDFCEEGVGDGCLETGYAAAFSPDGALLAVAGSRTGLEEDTMILRLSDGRQLRLFTGTDRFYGLSVVFTPDGQTVITGAGSVFGGTTGAIHFWDLESGELLQELTQHAGPVRALAISPDGQTLASGSRDATIKLWNLADASLVRTLTGHGGEVTELEFSPDSTRLVSSSVDHSLKIWNVSTGAVVDTMTGHTDAVESAAWSSDGKLIISAAGTLSSSGADKSIRLWDAASGTHLDTITQISSRVVDVRLGADDAMLMAADEGGIVSIRSAEDGEAIRSMNAGSALYSADLSRDGVSLAVGLWNHNLQLWNATTGTLRQTIAAHTSGVQAVAFSPDGVLVAAGDWDGPAKLYRVSDGGLVREYTSPNPGARAIAFSPDGGKIAVAGGTTILIRDVSSGAVLQTLNGHAFSINALAFSPDGASLASGASDATARLWRVADGALVYTLGASLYPVDSVAFSADGRVLVTGIGDRTLRFWRVEDGQLMRTYDGDTGARISSIDFSSDNSSFVFGREDAGIVRALNPFNVAGDLDADADVDLADYVLFAACLSGPDGGGQGGVPAGCDPADRPFADLDQDGDADLADFSAFMRSFGG